MFLTMTQCQIIPAMNKSSWDDDPLGFKQRAGLGHVVPQPGVGRNYIGRMENKRETPILAYIRFRGLGLDWGCFWGKN